MTKGPNSDAPKKTRRKRMPASLVAVNAMVHEQTSENIVKAWELRMAGRTVSEIATELGVSGTTAKSYLHRGLEAAREQYTASAMDHIQIVLGQLESIISKWRKLADCPVAEGADRAAAIVLRALEQKAKLLGLEGKGAGLVSDQNGGTGIIDLTEALASPATREALKAAIALAEAREVPAAQRQR